MNACVIKKFLLLKSNSRPGRGTSNVELSTAALRRFQVFEPPDILYWARGVDNSTVFDKLGLPWYCYTLQQTHCIPLFKTPANYRTTRRPGPKKVREHESRKADAFLHLARLTPRSWKRFLWSYGGYRFTVALGHACMRGSG